jgi:hypothetical protein
MSSEHPRPAPGRQRRHITNLCLNGIRRRGLIAVLLLLSQAWASAAVIESLEGAITPRELDSFLADIAKSQPQTSNAGNAMATHKSGTEIAGISKVFEATRDPRVLAHAVRFADAFCAYRNDQPKGTHTVQWTGQVEPVWPMSTTSDSAGGESAMIAGHIAYVAYLILATPAFWGSTVPDHDPYGFGATYKERGMTYLRFTDEALTRYLTRYCIKPGDFSIVNPTRTPADGEAPPWNIQAMYMLPHLYHALCHDLLRDQPADLALCKGVVNRYATWFVESAQYEPVADGPGAGTKVAKWYYLVPPDRQRKENQGHAQHDLRGLIAAFRSGYTTLTVEQMRCFANTARYRMFRGPHRWADNVHGEGPDRINLKADLIPLAEWDHGLFALAAESDLVNDPHVVDAGSETCLNAGFILYTKQLLADPGQTQRR